MKLKEYIESLNNIVKDNPKALEFDVIYSSDDEGNEHNELYFEPELGIYDSEELEFESSEIDANAVCIN